MKPNDMREIYLQACDAKGFQPNEGQLKTWREQLGYAEKRDLEEALREYWAQNSDFPMPNQLRHLVERVKRMRLAASEAPKELVDYVCPSCGAPFSTLVDPGDARHRICLVVNDKKELVGCRVRLTETSRRAA